MFGRDRTSPVPEGGLWMIPYSHRTHRSRVSVVVQCAPLFIALLMLLVSGCGTTNQGRPAFSIPTYGNFCGPMHPVTRNATNVEDVIELMTIKPFDDIDAACRRHDICYALAFYLNQKCDRWLVSELQRMNLMYSDEGHRLHCEHIRYGIVGAGKLAFGRTPTRSTGNPLSDAFRDTLNFVGDQFAGYTMAGFVIGLDSASRAFDKISNLTHNPCNNDNRRGGFKSNVHDLVFNDSLIEILQYKNHIDGAKAYQLRGQLGINTQASYTQRCGNTIEANMRNYKDHPVLSGNWKQMQKDQ